MKNHQFHQLITGQLGYQSPDRKRGLVTHLPGLKPLLYYGSIVGAFFTANLAGRRGKLDNERWLTASLSCLKAVESAGGRVIVSGLEGVSEHSGPLVYIANHMSILETLLLPSFLLAFNDVTFIIKDELRHYPIIGRVMQALRLIAVHRQHPREDLKIVLTEGHQRLCEGSSVVVFPQATRSTVFEEKSFNTLYRQRRRRPSARGRVH